MSERVWARVGQIGTALAGIVGVIALVHTLNAPSNQLIAEIRPMAFRLPITAGQLGELTRTDKSGNAALGQLMQVRRATGLVKIDLYNNGDFPISGIHINVDSDVLYAKGTEGQDNSLVLPSDQSGTTLDTMTQGSSATVYVWTEVPPALYRHWYTLDENFKITFSQGVARKYIYIEGSQLSGWFERNIGSILLCISGASFLVAFYMSTLGRRTGLKRDPPDDRGTDVEIM